jgi:NAD(P)-dependent dehydrogenase (short-subunit alcohol dehydrogenase family)
MTLPIAHELARYGFRVIIIAPGIFETRMAGQIPPDVAESLGKMCRSHRGSAARKSSLRSSARSSATRWSTGSRKARQRDPDGAEVAALPAAICGDTGLPTGVHYKPEADGSQCGGSGRASPRV